MLTYRQLEQKNLDGLYEIDRSDFSPSIYRMKLGTLILEESAFRHTGFTPAEWDRHIQKFRTDLQNGSIILFGAFDGDAIVGISGLEVDQYWGAEKDMFNMSPMWVTACYRRRGIGKRLLEMARKKAREIGVKALYISATPVPGTVEFYLKAGCRVLPVPDPYMYDLEPEDIHMRLEI